MLNEKQESFVQHYILTRNATEAAKAAGYHYPGKTAEALMRRVDINDAIKYMAEVKREMVDEHGEFTIARAQEMYLDAYAMAATSTEMKNCVDSMVKLHGLAAAEKVFLA